jgi:hypothetical protein
MSGIRRRIFSRGFAAGTQSSPMSPNECDARNVASEVVLPEFYPRGRLAATEATERRRISINPRDSGIPTEFCHAPAPRVIVKIPLTDFLELKIFCALELPAQPRHSSLCPAQAPR